MRRAKSSDVQGARRGTRFPGSAEKSRVSIQTRARGRGAKVIGILFVASLAVGPSSPLVRAQDTSPAPSGEQLSPEQLRARDDWRIGIATVPLPKEGCFEATFPKREWAEVACVAPPDVPMTPPEGARPLVVGSGNDISAEAPSGFITTAIGSFDIVTNVTSESSPIANAGARSSERVHAPAQTRTCSRAPACSGALNPASVSRLGTIRCSTTPVPRGSPSSSTG